MRVIVFYSQFPTELCECRRFTEEEKKKYAAWYRDIGLVGTGNNVEVSEILLKDLEPQRESCGSFCGTNNQAYEVTDEEWDALIFLNNKRLVEKKTKEVKEEIAYYEIVIEEASKQKLRTSEEAEKFYKKYNDTFNEGGYGFIPHVYTFEEVEHAKLMLEKLRKMI